ncbi:MAG TPA: uroporphyrinogen-III synthase [Opitutaceae bacterium]|nr:uroporphyrinogen-III synthase [Opitutaceae bacterium]
MSAPAHPLAGKRVAVTRTREQASELTARLAALGAEVLELPVLRITREIPRETLADVMLEFGSYDWLVFTSANGVRHFFEEFFRLFDDIRSLGLIRIACVGDGTGRRLAELHLKIECQPAVATAEALAEALVETGSLDSAKILVVTGNLNRDTLTKKLEAAGAIVDELPVYKTEPVDLSGSPAAADFRKRGADAVLFASSSSVESYLGQGRALALEAGARQPLRGSIGPQTSAMLRKHKLAPDFEAENPGLDALVAALVRRLAKP